MESSWVIHLYIMKVSNRTFLFSTEFFCSEYVFSLKYKKEVGIEGIQLIWTWK
jgi:hypothetical protein